MWEPIKTNLLLPLAGRIGTAATTALVAAGINSEHANMLGIGVVGVLLIACDLVTSYFTRKRSE